mmetsp:Transcript_2132/g.5031  ORF Transcript_2132/g.5031 Transcript_2132/m.5031 type:complete len:129 (-) Transcript_2132:375-761(-)
MPRAQMIPIFQQKKIPNVFLSLYFIVKTVAMSNAKMNDSKEFEKGRVSIPMVGQALPRSNTGIGTPPFLAIGCESRPVLQIAHTLRSTTKTENNEQVIRGITKTSIPEKLLVVSSPPIAARTTTRSRL